MEILIFQHFSHLDKKLHYMLFEGHSRPQYMQQEHGVCISMDL